ncbi:MAG TPA: hypothetical protein VKG20_06635 [Methylomirabilota bacterium]|nr:hypothetical protein [Methylomirabilota bacterium]
MSPALRFTVALFFLSLSLAAALAGCASSASDTWTKPDVTEQQRGRDTLDCLTEAKRVTPGPGGPVEQVNQDRYRRCMTDRGYTSGPAK